MGGREKACDAALAILKRWQWSYCDPDGEIWPSPKALVEVVYRLAMEGVAYPEDAVLQLMCSGALRATADYNWRKYQAGRFYQLEGHGVEVPLARWQQLADAIAREAKELAGSNFGLESAVLEKLELGSCYPFEWESHDSRFNLAICPPETDYRTPGYVEEWYSARDIMVNLPDTSNEPVAPSVVLMPDENAFGASKGGAPRRWDWDGAMAYLAALAHYSPDGLIREDGTDPNSSDIAEHLLSWFVRTKGVEPSNSMLRKYGARFVAELNALKLGAADNPSQ